MTWRELRSFVRNLPRESAYARSVHGELVDWGVAEHVLATIANDQRSANSGKKRLPDKDLIIPPGARATRPAKARVNGHDKPGGLAELNALFDGG